MYKNWLSFIGSDSKLAPVAGLAQDRRLLRVTGSAGEMSNHSEGNKLRTVRVVDLPLRAFSHHVCGHIAYFGIDASSQWKNPATSILIYFGHAMHFEISNPCLVSHSDRIKFLSASFYLR